MCVIKLQDMSDVQYNFTKYKQLPTPSFLFMFVPYSQKVSITYIIDVIVVASEL